ncbi:MAG: diacylglycerol kinase family protein [Chloroflexota bacterium]
MRELATPTPYERKQTLIIINPVAHNMPAPNRLREAEQWLIDEGWDVTVEETTGPGTAEHIAARAAERGIPLVIGCGGDGTVGEVANGLVGTGSTMGTIPGGTSNIFAREIDLDKKPLEAVQRMVYGERRLIDTGVTGNRHFVLFAGFGIDAAVTQTVPLRVKSRLGAAAYAMSAAREALRWRGQPIVVRLDGVERWLNVLQAFAGNTRLYAGITKITPAAVADDGKLDVCVYSGRGKIDIVFHAARTLLQMHRNSSKVIYGRASKIEFEWEYPLPVQLDGDPLPDCPREINVAPLSLSIATPAGVASPIFSRPPQQAQELSLPSQR